MTMSIEVPFKRLALFRIITLLIFVDNMKLLMLNLTNINFNIPPYIKDSLYQQVQQWIVSKSGIFTLLFLPLKDVRYNKP